MHDSLALIVHEHQSKADMDIKVENDEFFFLASYFKHDLQ